MAFVVLCSECHKFFPMKEIKSDAKKCPACGRTVKWRTLKKDPRPSMKDAIEAAIALNEEQARTGPHRLKDIVRH